ncbi:MAG: RNA polymerase subunit sigma-70, partial [Candidatus Binatia bacterium]
VPDARVIPADADPHEQTALRQSIRMAFVAALQHLPPKQRAALLMTEVLGWSAAEVADTLETSVASVNSALQRARATLGSRNLQEAPPSLTDPELQLVNRYVEAFERYDIKALTALMTEDATLSMPPYSFWVRGHAKIADWMLGGGINCRGSRFLPTAACGQPAFGHYRDGGRTPWALLVLEVGDAGITSMTSFLDVDDLFPLFGLPRQLPA